MRDVKGNRTLDPQVYGGHSHIAATAYSTLLRLHYGALKSTCPVCFQQVYILLAVKQAFDLTPVPPHPASPPSPTGEGKWKSIYFVERGNKTL
jgi:hypothetical protein